MARTYTVKSPAKINIGLRVLSGRKDGFHNIETIFYPIKLYDSVQVRIGKQRRADDRITVSVSGAKFIDNKHNLCYRAAMKYLQAFKPGGSYKIDIHIKKVIPIGAGLGGGSSNAAAVLRILHKHFAKRDLTPAEKLRQQELLKKLALQLGSDVPFFIECKPAYASGRGEKLKFLSNFKLSGKLLLVNPGIHVSTTAAYKDLKVRIKKPTLMNSIKKFDPNDSRMMINDFEKVIFRKFPEIEKIKYEMLSLGAEFALMSGSGSTVYGVFPLGRLHRAERYFRNNNYKVFAA